MFLVRRLALASALAAAAPALAEGVPTPGPVPAGDVVALRFSWPEAARARVTYRRTRSRTGEKPRVFTARYETRAERAEDGIRIATRGTTWRGEIPFPAALAKDAISASEAVVQRVRAEGEFAGLDGAEAIRPVLARLFEDAKVPPDERERAIAVAERAMRAEAEEVWNLAVGFWIDADLAVGEAYALESEADIPLAPGSRARQAVEFSVRRRVPCAAGERAPRCVEATLRSTPDQGAVERASPALLSRFFPDGEVPAGAGKDLTAESELVLVTDPATLLPRRVVWTKAVRLGAGDSGPFLAEQVDRSEYDYRWLPPEPVGRAKTRRRPAPPAPPAPRAPAPAASAPESGGAALTATARTP